jgi:hypothetical protein
MRRHGSERDGTASRFVLRRAVIKDSNEQYIDATRGYPQPPCSPPNIEMTAEEPRYDGAVLSIRKASSPTLRVRIRSRKRKEGEVGCHGEGPERRTSTRNSVRAPLAPGHPPETCARNMAVHARAGEGRHNVDASLGLLLPGRENATSSGGWSGVAGTRDRDTIDTGAP